MGSVIQRATRSLLKPLSSSVVLLFLFCLAPSFGIASESISISPSSTDGSNTAVSSALSFDGNVASFATIGMHDPSSDNRNLLVNTASPGNLGTVAKVEMVVVHSHDSNPSLPTNVRIRWHTSSGDGSFHDLALDPSQTTESFDVTGEQSWAFSNFDQTTFQVQMVDTPSAGETLSYLIYEVYFQVTYEPLKVYRARTLDRNANGKIDAYEISFIRDINDATICTSSSGFTVPSAGGETVLLGTVAADIPNDNVIYLGFNENAISSGDTADTPDLIYAPATGCGIRAPEGDYLHPFGSADLTEEDGAPPAIIQARANDASGGGPGIQAGDEIQLTFSEGTNKPALDAFNINAALKLSPSTHTWLSGGGTIYAANWSLGGDILTVVLSVASGAPTLVPGTTKIILDETSFPSLADAVANISSCSITVSGNFGAGGSPPVIVSRETGDLDHDGFIDAIKITFDKNVCDASVSTTDWRVQGTVLKGFSSSPAGSGDVADDNKIFLTFFETASLTTDRTPNISYTQGSLVNHIGSGCGSDLVPSSSLTPSTDKAGPVPFNATASDGSVFISGIDLDDTVVVNFSEPTNRPVLDSLNIETLFALTPSSHSWGNIATSWLTPSRLLVSFSTPTFQATLLAGDTVRVRGGALLTDLVVNSATGSVVLGGSFVGVDTTSPTVVSISPSDGAVGKPLSSAIKVRFSERMDEISAKNAVSLTVIRNKDGVDAGSPVTGSRIYDSATSEVTLTLPTLLTNNTTYRIRVSTGASDTIGNSMAALQTATFTTLLNHNESNTMKGSDNKTSVKLETGCLPEDGYVQISIDPVAAPQRVLPSNITRANQKFLADDDPYTAVIGPSIRELNAYTSSGLPLSGSFGASASLTIPYPDADNDGYVDGMSPRVRVETLRIFTLDESHQLWVRVADSSIDRTKKAVTAPIPHFSVYALAGVADTNLGAAYAFPVPFKPSRGDKVVTFVNLSPRASIKIFTLDGKLVRVLSNDGNASLEWDVKNDQGESVTSGTYLYLIQNESSQKKGKLMVIR